MRLKALSENQVLAVDEFEWMAIHRNGCGFFRECLCELSEDVHRELMDVLEVVVKKAVCDAHLLRYILDHDVMIALVLKDLGRADFDFLPSSLALGKLGFSVRAGVSKAVAVSPDGAINRLRSGYISQNIWPSSMVRLCGRLTGFQIYY